MYYVILRSGWRYTLFYSMQQKAVITSPRQRKKKKSVMTVVFRAVNEMHCVGQCKHARRGLCKVCRPGFSTLRTGRSLVWLRAVCRHANEHSSAITESLSLLRKKKLKKASCKCRRRQITAASSSYVATDHGNERRFSSIRKHKLQQRRMHFGTRGLLGPCAEERPPETTKRTQLQNQGENAGCFDQLAPRLLTAEARLQTVDCQCTPNSFLNEGGKEKSGNIALLVRDIERGK